METPISTYFIDLAKSALDEMAESNTVTVYRTRVYPVTALPAAFVYPLVDSLADSEPSEIGWLLSQNRAVFREFTFGITILTHVAEDCEALMAETINSVVGYLGVEERVRDAYIRDVRYDGKSDAVNSVYEASVSVSIRYETRSNNQLFNV